MSGSEKGKIAVIGSGLIGRSWAMVFLSGGYSVTLYDIEEQQTTHAKTQIRQQLDQLEKDGLLRGKTSASEQISLVSVSNNLSETVSGATYVQECVPELKDLKEKVFRQLGDLATDGVVLASSSSAMPASTFTESMARKEQALVCHPINPPYFVPAVEVVPTPSTAPEIVEKAQKILREVGQVPVLVKKEVPAFIVPRIQNAIIQESLKLVLDDVISAEDVDKVMSCGLGMRYAFMGPFETVHLNAEGVNSYVERYGEMIYEISSESGPPVPMKPDSAEMQRIQDELSQFSPMEKLAERRKWRDRNVARLSRLKADANKNEDVQE